QLLSLALFCCAGCAGLSSFLSSWILYLHHAPTPTQALDLGLSIAMTRTAASALVGSALVTITCGTAFLGTARRNARALGEAPANTHAAARQALAALCM